LAVGAILTAYLGAAACSADARAADGPPAYPYRIVTTVGMVADIARQVSGEVAEVHELIGAGVDPHLYKPTRSDVAALMSADVVLYNGLRLEGKMGDLLDKIRTSGRLVHAVTSGIDESYLLAPAEFQGHFDPHVWMDVSAWSKAVESVAAVLSAYDVPNAAAYASNAQRYRKELEQLDAYARNVIASIPAERRVLITAHDAFNYFGRAYGIEVRGIQGISTESEAGLQDITRLVDLIVERRVQAVFVETSVADKNVRALCEGAKARGHEVRIGGTLFSDAMGRAGTYEGTYIGMIDHNATVIARALGGEAPKTGMQGKLGGSVGVTD